MRIVQVLMAAVLAVQLSGCATLDGSRRPLSTNEKIASCVGMVIGGAILGKLIGGDQNGAQTGAAIGGATCAAWLAFNNEADKRRIADAERAALASGMPQEDAWRGPDGQAKQIKVSLTPEQATQGPDGAPTLCRFVRTTIMADGSYGENEVEYCRTPDGDYRPRGEIGT